MSKLKRTNERCYICDFARTGFNDDPNEQSFPDEIVEGVYREGLPVDWTIKGRYVFFDPATGKPICSSCYREVKAQNHWLMTATPHVKVTPTALTETRVWEITDEHHRQVDEIRRKKGYLKSPEDEEKARLARNARLDATWQPLPERGTKTSDWPKKNAGATKSPRLSEPHDRSCPLP